MTQHHRLGDRIAAVGSHVAVETSGLAEVSEENLFFVAAGHRHPSVCDCMAVVRARVVTVSSLSARLSPSYKDS